MSNGAWPADIVFALQELSWDEFQIVTSVLLEHTPIRIAAGRNKMSVERAEALIAKARASILKRLREYDDQYHPLRREAQHGPDVLRDEAPADDDAEA